MRNIWEERLHSHTKLGIFPLSLSGSIAYSFNRPEKQREALGDDSSLLLPKKNKTNQKAQDFYLSEGAFDSAHSTGVPLTGT